MPETRFHPDDRIHFRLGGRTLQGVVKEDRGTIGVHGRRLYLIEFHADTDSPSWVELPADQLQAIASTRSGSARSH